MTTSAKNYRLSDLAKPEVVKTILQDILAEFYPDHTKVTDISLTTHKRHFKDTALSRIVIGCTITCSDKKPLELIIAAAEDGTREEAFANTQLLYQHGFDRGNLLVTRPLVYLAGPQAMVYETAMGKPLYQFLKQQPAFDDLLQPLNLAASWLKKLHQLELTPDEAKIIRGYNWDRVVGLIKPYINIFAEESAKQSEKLKKILQRLIAYHQDLSGPVQPRLVYGDYHPENIIISSLQAKEIIGIDFTDLTYGDPYRDLGTFIQQLDFMSQRFLPREEINKLKKHFLRSYFDRRFSELPLAYIQRINLYQALTALRTAVWLFKLTGRRQVSLECLNDAWLITEKMERQEKSVNLR